MKSIIKAMKFVLPFFVLCLTCFITVISVKAESTETFTNEVEITDQPIVNSPILPPEYSIFEPECDIVQYYCGVQYRWTAGDGADDMSCTDNTTYRRRIHGTYLQECSVVSNSHPTICPCWHNNCAASYYSRYLAFSNTVFAEDFNGGQSGRSRFSTTKYLNRTLVDSIPNQIDQNNFIWEHDGAYHYIIHATIEYNNEMTDVDLNIPLLGYNSITFTVGGQSFTMRTGPNKVSVKANSSSNLPLSDFCFAFKAANY